MFRVLAAIFGFIFGSIRRSSQRINTNQRLDNIDDQNDNQKNVIDYRDCPIEAFISHSSSENIVISGNNSGLRNRVNCAVAWRCHEAQRGAVVLHFGNETLRRLMSDTFHGVSGFHSVNSENPIYDPFLDLNKQEIAQIVLNSSGNNYRIERIGNSYVYGLCDYLQLLGRPVCIDTIYNCLRDRSYETLLEDQENGIYSDFVVQRIVRELEDREGQREHGNVEQYFSVLKQQGQGVLATESSFCNAISIKHALRAGEIIMIDLGDATNELLLNVVAQEIRDAISSGLRFSLIVDSIPLDASESLGRMFRNFSGMCTYVYSSQDVYADTQSTANVFETLLSRANTVFVMQHYSATASQRFSDFFGQYQKVEVNHTFTRGDNYMTYGQILPGSSAADVYGTQQVNKPRVEEREISAQGANHVFIKEGGRSEIISVNCTQGDARTRYDFPQRNTSSRVRRRRGRINWWLFAVLFVCFFPAAFVYSFFKSGRVGKVISVILLLLTALYVLAASQGFV